jgi:hypothetical protein
MSLAPGSCFERRKDVPSPKEVRRILSKIRGPMAQTVIEESEDRFEMPTYFFDSGALVKHDHAEQGSPNVELILGESERITPRKPESTFGGPERRRIAGESARDTFLQSCSMGCRNLAR